MVYNLECPKCGHKFTLDGKYECGECPECQGTRYVWDYVLDDNTFDELFADYYFYYIV